MQLALKHPCVVIVVEAQRVVHQHAVAAVTLRHLCVVQVLGCS